MHMTFGYSLKHTKNHITMLRNWCFDINYQIVDERNHLKLTSHKTEAGILTGKGHRDGVNIRGTHIVS